MKPCADNAGMDFSGLKQPFQDLVQAQLTLGKALAGVLSAGGAAAASTLRGLSVDLPKMKSCCDIPEPCWMPKGLGEVKCRLAEGGTGEIHLTITNDDYKGRNYTVMAAGSDAGLVTFTKTSFYLGPKERTIVNATLVMPAQTLQEIDLVLWVKGCSDQYVRWTITPSRVSKACCYEVSVNDTPDYVVHWYDHFYCPRPCFGTPQDGVGATHG